MIFVKELILMFSCLSKVMLIPSNLPQMRIYSLKQTEWGGELLCKTIILRATTVFRTALLGRSTAAMTQSLSKEPSV